MSKSVKEVIIGTMKNGPEVMNELAMAKKIGSDIEIQRGDVRRKIAQYHPPFINLKVIEKEEINPVAVRIRLSAVDGTLPVFEAGQYINIFVEVDNCKTSRPYSIATPPSQRGYYDIIVGRIEDGFVSDYLMDSLEVGQELVSTGPMGAFRYQPIHHKKHQVMLAGGSGITPMQSMTLEALGRGLDRQIILFYGIRKIDYAINHELFKKLEKDHPNFTYVPVLSEEESQEHECGFISKDIISKYVPNLNEATFFLCGPEVMNTYCVDQLQSMGVRPAMIRRELFQSRRDIENEKGWPENISPMDEFKIKCAGHTFKAKAGENILTALERQNIEVKVGCRSGECSYCRMKLVSGQIYTAQGNLARLADEVFGYIHVCKTYPISDIELEF